MLKFGEENKQRMYEGRLYDPADPGITGEQGKCLKKLFEWNQIPSVEFEKREQMAKELFAEFGEGSYVEPPFYANWGGKNIHLGKRCYFNFSCTLVDDGDIFIGDGCMFGPNVTIATAGHPIQPKLRERQLQYNLPVHIGNNVWVGAGAIILPGVNIGDNCVIGAGSVVTKDIPANTVAVGNPCRVLREIGEHDDKYYWRDKEIDVEIE